MKRTKPAGAHSGPESAFQIAAITEIRLRLAPLGIPAEAIMHPPNGGHRHIGVAKKLKAEGVTPGYCDILIFHKEDIRATDKRNGLGDRKVGLGIELKIWNGKPSEEQLKVHGILREAGWQINVCYGMDEVIAIVKSYFFLK